MREREGGRWVGGGEWERERDMCVSECVCEKNILRKRA